MSETGYTASGVFWYAAGQGPGLLLIHGAGGNSAIWWDQVEAFSRTHRVVAYDMAGFGRTPAPVPDAFAASFAANAEEVMDAAGLASAAVVCQSLGGWAGLRLALAAPQRVERLVLSCTMAGIAHPPALDSFRASQSKMDKTGPASIALSEAFRAAHPAKAYLYQQAGAFNPPFDPALVGKVFGPETLISPERINDVRCPVLILSGEQDAIWPPSALEGLAPMFPDVRMHVVPACGHSPYFELPEEFNRLVAAFLDAPAA